MTGMLLLLLLAGEAGAEDEDSATSNDIVEDASCTGRVRRQGAFFDNDRGAMSSETGVLQSLLLVAVVLFVARDLDHREERLLSYVHQNLLSPS
jgi:hypothetical protein